MVQIALLALLGQACSSGPERKELDTAQRGRIRIAADESFRGIVNGTIVTYEGLYKDASFDTAFVSEGEAFQMLLNDSARVIVANRRLNAEEKAHFAKRKITPDEVLFAYDAVAVIVNRANADSLFSLLQLKSILSGQMTQWPATRETIVPVFDKANSSNLNFLQARLGVAKAAEMVTAAGSNPAVVEYVRTHPNAIGFIGLGWISDTDNANSVGFERSIRVAGISKTDPAVKDSAFQPYQAYLAQKQYPLMRDVYLVSGEYHNGLGTGFINLAASDKGQRIVLKSGLLPATMPVRIVNLNKKAL